MSKPSLTVLVTAYNEEKTIAESIHSTVSALKKYLGDSEIIVIDDGSADNTGKVIDALAKKNKSLRVVHNKLNRNLGYNMRLGVSMAKKEYCMAFINGDGPPTEEAFSKLFATIGKKGLVLGYSLNYGNRHWFRRFLSWAFVKVMNFLFRFNIRYYNGPIILKTKVWQSVPMTTNNFAYMAEVTTTLLKRHVTYIEVPVVFSIPEQKGINLKMLSRNIGGVAITLGSLFFRLNIKKQLYV
ncbi:MAG: glycosyltransferase family 2 protein [Actinobacteria bacterium]|nr:glycosyltransferase family 2 protein [Actinomycetota bacterium]